MNRTFGRGWGGYYHPHPQLTPAQQTARAEAVTAERGLDDQLDAFKASVHSAVEAGVITLPSLPQSVADAYAAELKAKADVKSADDAAAAATASTSTASESASPSAAATP